jgi:hypothetical protein
VSARQSEQVARAIAMLRADPTLTRYQAAKANGLTPSALYNSRECRELMAQRDAKKENNEKQ